MQEQALQCGSLAIRLWNEHCYTLGSVDNVHRYDKEYELGDDRFVFASMHGVECREADGETHSCVVAASGGATGIHEHSGLVRDDSLFLAVGDSLCRLSTSSLEMIWHKKVDDATCFGVHWSDKHKCLVVHGELVISRVSLDGEVAWSAGGKDIFTGSIELFDDYVIAEDFENNRYHIDLLTGESRLL